VAGGKQPHRRVGRRSGEGAFPKFARSTVEKTTESLTRKKVSIQKSQNHLRSQAQRARREDALVKVDIVRCRVVRPGEDRGLFDGPDQLHGCLLDKKSPIDGTYADLRPIRLIWDWRLARLEWDPGADRGGEPAGGFASAPIGPWRPIRSRTAGANSQVRLLPISSPLYAPRGACERFADRLSPDEAFRKAGRTTRPCYSVFSTALWMRERETGRATLPQTDSVKQSSGRLDCTTRVLLETTVMGMEEGDIRRQRSHAVPGATERR